MSIADFGRLLHDAKLRKNHKEWFPRWILRYASSAGVEAGLLPVSQGQVIRFLRSLLKSETPAWQRLHSQ